MLTYSGHRARPSDKQLSLKPLSFHTVFESLLRMGCFPAMEGRQLPPFSELPFEAGLGDLGFSPGASAAAGICWADRRHSSLRGGLPG